jgi:hypothetical protein
MPSVSGYSSLLKQARSIIRDHDGTIRTAEALRAGIHPRTLYRMRDEGILETVSRGTFRLAEAPALSGCCRASLTLTATPWAKR